MFHLYSAPSQSKKLPAAFSPLVIIGASAFESPGHTSLIGSKSVLPMAAQSKSFSFCSLPRPHQAERVEYPGRIVHIDRAVATLGGSAELAKQFSTKKAGESSKDAGSSVQLSLKLGLASSLPNASDAVHTTALTGDSTASRGFLLCITLDDKGSASEASIVASYKRTHSFHRLADFVYRRDSPSAASYIATRGVINGVSPSVAQVDVVAILLRS
jgi:hypothetical protein